MCPSVENPDLVYQQTGNSQSSTHPRPAECDSRQAIQARSYHPDRVVPSPRGLPGHMLPVAPAPSGPVCHQVQQQTSTVCVSGSRPPGMGSGCTQSALGRSGSICLPTSSLLGQSGGEVAGLPMQHNHTDCTRVAQHALVLGSSGHGQSDPSVPALTAQSGVQPFNQTLHRNLSNLKLYAWLLEPQQSRSRASLKQWQHELRLLKRDQPDPCVRQSGSFLQSGASVIRWTSGHHL